MIHWVLYFIPKGFSGLCLVSTKPKISHHSIDQVEKFVVKLILSGILIQLGCSYLVSALITFEYWPKVVMLDQNMESVTEFGRLAQSILCQSQPVAPVAEANLQPVRFKITPKKLRSVIFRSCPCSFISFEIEPVKLNGQNGKSRLFFIEKTGLRHLDEGQSTLGRPIDDCNMNREPFHPHCLISLPTLLVGSTRKIFH